MNHRQFFDSLADKWDKDRNHDEIKKIGELIQKIDIDDDEFILDVGAGTGILFPFLKTNRHIAIDISFNMLKKAQAKFSSIDNLVQADVHTLPFDGTSFDRTILFAVFPHLPDKIKALRELSRILRPKGRINIMHSASREEINNFHREYGGVIKNDFIPDEAEMVDLLKSAGFNDIKIFDLHDRYLARGIKKIGGI